MRSWLLIFLLAWMPLQLGWAAAASYCQHETGAAARHPGHHDHEHQAATGQEAPNDPASSTLGTDPDCASCHAGSLPALATTVAQPSLVAPPRSTTDYAVPWSSPPGERLERPQWRALA